MLQKVKFCVKNCKFHLSRVDKSSKKWRESERKLRVANQELIDFAFSIFRFEIDWQGRESPEAELESKILRAPTKIVWGNGSG